MLINMAQNLFYWFYETNENTSSFDKTWGSYEAETFMRNIHLFYSIMLISFAVFVVSCIIALLFEKFVLSEWPLIVLQCIAILCGLFFMVALMIICAIPHVSTYADKVHTYTFKQGEVIEYKLSMSNNDKKEYVYKVYRYQRDKNGFINNVFSKKYISKTKITPTDDVFTKNK